MAHVFDRLSGLNLGPWRPDQRWYGHVFEVDTPVEGDIPGASAPDRPLGEGQPRGVSAAGRRSPFHKEQAPVERHPQGSELQLNALRKAIAQAHIDVAANFIAARPRQSLAKVAAVLCWPNTEWSQVCAFFDLDYFQRFETRDSDHQRWTPLPRQRSLSREIGLRAPARLRERGYHEWSFDPSSQSAPYEGEVWMFGE